MTESTHGHEVMRMMLETGEPYTRDSLISAIRERFGAEARFHTCSAADLTPEGVVDFLAAKGKFAGHSDALGMKPDSICDHE